MNAILRNIAGWIIILALWWIVSALELVNTHILPTPGSVYTKFWEMWADEQHGLGENILFSLKINFAGYIESICIAIPVGFALGLKKTIREMFSMQIGSMRFIPITALGGLFVALSGFTIWTKIHFLSFGILLYLIPVTVQRITEINPLHLQMMQTLGANQWQTFWYVQWPSVSARLSDDIRILVATSWTYIIVAELKNITFGLGSLIYLSERRSSIEMVYVVLLIIVTIGMIQDKIFKFFDWLLFRHKYE